MKLINILKEIQIGVSAEEIWNLASNKSKQKDLYKRKWRASLKIFEREGYSFYVNDPDIPEWLKTLSSGVRIKIYNELLKIWKNNINEIQIDTKFHNNQELLSFLNINKDEFIDFLGKVLSKDDEYEDIEEEINEWKKGGFCYENDDNSDITFDNIDNIGISFNYNGKAEDEVEIKKIRFKGREFYIITYNI